MQPKTNFNYFTVLAKDDKELIHSSFIQFLLSDEQLSSTISKELFPAFNSQLDKNSITLEKVYSYKQDDNYGNKKRKRVRIDIEAHSIDRNSVLVIENKFKSFPYEEQLNLYNQRFQLEYPNKTIIKYLICFDSSIVPQTFDKGDWNFISYNDVLKALKVALDNIILDKDKQTFVEHYIHFLTEYFDKYEEVKKSCGYLFFDGRNEENKFWIRHINAITRLKLEEYFFKKNIPVAFNVNPGNTSVPLLDIFPKHWNKENRVNVLVQVQDNNLKYYYHHNDHSELNKLIQSTQNILGQTTGKFNKLSPNRGKTNFIYQEVLDRSIKNATFTIDDFSNRIIEFYEKIDTVARNRFIIESNS